MDLQQLRYFTAIALHGSISSAALALGVTQPTISQALRGLEFEMHTPLFFRLGRGMVLTSAGHTLLGPARRILRSSAVARESLQTRGKALAGRLDISVTSPATSGIVPALLAKFILSNPKVTLNVRSLSSEDDIASTIDERVSEIVFTQLPYLSDTSPRRVDIDLTVREIGSTTIQFAEPLGEHVGGEPSAPRSRDEYRRILAPSADYAYSTAGHSLASTPRRSLPPIVADKRQTRLALVIAGIGATLVGQAAASVAAEHGVATSPLEPPVVHRIGMVYGVDGLSDVAAAFVGFERSASLSDSASSTNASLAGDG
jgi:DNA-binding transcriptional LysR family regulator